MTDLPTTVDELSSLAEKGAIAVVGALATGTFQAARDGIARLFARLGSGRRTSAEKRMDADEERVTEAEDTERDEVRRDLVPVWRRDLVKLLTECPEAVQELVELLDVLNPASSEASRSWLHQQVTVGDHATAYAAQGGNVFHYQGGAPRRTPPADPPEDDTAR